MKYVYVDMDRKVREIIPEFVKAFPGMSADKRYSPDYLKKCLPVPDEVEVEQGMEYLPLENRFVRPVRFTGAAHVTAAPGESVTIPVSFSVEGDWEVTDDGGLILNKTADGLYVPDLSEGRYAITVRLALEDQTVEQVIAITVEEPAQELEEAAEPAAESDPDRLSALEARLSQLESLLGGLLALPGVNT